MSKIIIVTTSLSSGGITSFLIPLTNLLADEGHEVTLAYTCDNGDYLSRIRTNVHKLPFKALDKRKSLLAGLKNFALYDMAKIYLRKSTQRPHYPSVQRFVYLTAKYTTVTNDSFDIAISTAEGFCNYLVANKIKAKKKIGWVHPDMATLGMDKKAGKKVLDKLDYLVAVGEPGYNTLKGYFPEDEEKILYIENMIDNESIIKRSQECINDMPTPEGYRILVTVCRITNDSKRIDRIIKIGSLLHKRGFKYRWYIIGDGPDYSLIEKMIKEYSLESCVKLLGGRINPLPYVDAADCFVLTSQYEGKPVVVEEAKVLHKPVFCTAYSSAKQQVGDRFGKVFSNIDGKLELEIADAIQKEDFSLYKEKYDGYAYDNSKSVKKINEIID